MWEVMTQREAWSDLSDAERAGLARAVRQGRRPPTTDLPHDFAALMAETWVASPRARPLFAAVECDPRLSHDLGL